MLRARAQVMTDIIEEKDQVTLNQAEVAPKIEIKAKIEEDQNIANLRVHHLPIINTVLNLIIKVKIRKRIRSKNFIYCLFYLFYFYRKWKS